MMISPGSRSIFRSSTQPERERIELSTTGVLLTQDDLDELATWSQPDLFGASSIAETQETPMRQQTKPWWRLQSSAERSLSHARLWCFLAPVCIVTGLCVLLWIETHGSACLLP